jgi:hypothetical protein
MTGFQNVSKAFAAGVEQGEAFAVTLVAEHTSLERVPPAHID